MYCCMAMVIQFQSPVILGDTTWPDLLIEKEQWKNTIPALHPLKTEGKKWDSKWFKIIAKTTWPLELNLGRNMIRATW